MENKRRKTNTCLLTYVELKGRIEKGDVKRTPKILITAYKLYLELS